MALEPTSARGAEGSSRAHELRFEAETLERAAEWIDGSDPMAAPQSALFKQMHYDSHSARHRRRGGPGAPGSGPKSA